MTGRPVITPEIYDALLIAYREEWGNISHASREAGCSRDVARRAWEKGWKRVEWAKPIREVIRGEINAAKSARADRKAAEEKKQEELREKAHQDSIDTLKEEAIASMVARRNAIGTSSAMARVVAALPRLAEKMAKAIQDESIDLKSAVKLMGDIAFSVRQANESVRIALDVERRRLGEPTQIIGLAHSEDISTEEAVQELLSLQRTLTRAQITPQRFGAYKTLPNGTTVIDLPEEAFEEESSAQIINFPHKADTKGDDHGKDEGGKG